MPLTPLVAFLVSAALGVSTATSRGTDADRPNFVIILADDMGFSDPGCFGGEIHTPHLDELARGGLRFTQFHNAARCCPTRASLLTGLYPHQVGMAKNGRTLSRQSATLAEVLRAAGYQTGMAGKWHLSRTTARESQDEQLAWLSHHTDFGDFAPRPSYPSRRGFDQHWGVIWGVVNYFDPFSLVHNEEPIRQVPEGFYMTDFVTEKSVAMIEAFSQVDRPFFLYVAHTAPHWPLHAPEAEIAPYRGMYDGGWEALRRARYERQIRAGLFDRQTTPLPANSSGRTWQDCHRRGWEAAHMEVHAAMVTRMDRGIGRVVAKLEEGGELENTLILFLSDNGASPERGYPPGFDRPDSLRDGTPIRYTFERPGPADTWGYLGAAWASAVNTPFRYWKKESFEGGTCTPAIVHWPRGLATGGGAISTAVCHVMDVMPTLVELAGIQYPRELDGRRVLEPEGTSLVPLLRGEAHTGREALYWEHDGGRAVRQGRWKLVSLPDGEWELFDLATDRSETTDLARDHPARADRLAALWTAWWQKMQGAVTVFRSGDAYPVYRIPAIVRATNGDLLAFCEGRQGGDASRIDLVMKRSRDGGATWGALRVVQASEDFRSLFGEDPPPITVGNPALVVDRLDPDHPGRIWLPFTLENDRVFVTFSDDHGHTWSERREITSTVKPAGWGWYATGPAHSIQLRRGPRAGRLVVPADHRLGAPGADRGALGAQVIFSDDHGRTWQLGAVDETYEDDLNANETTVAELVSGRLYFNTRDHKGEAMGTRGEAFSDDGGASFVPSGDTRYRAFRPAPEILDPPVVQCALLRAASRAEGDGYDVILFSGPDENGPSGPGRSDLRIRFSTDEGRSWRDGPLLHTGPAAYSDMVRIAPGGGRIGVVFEAGDPGGSPYERIDFVELSLSSLPLSRE